LSRILQWHAQHIRGFVHSILKATHDGLAPSHIRYFLANITISLLHFAFSSKLKLLWRHILIWVYSVR